jgi:hypothetical protein
MTTAMTYNRSSTRRLLAISLVALAFTGLLSPGSFATVSAISGLPGDSSHTAASIETLVPMPVHATMSARRWMTLYRQKFTPLISKILTPARVTSLPATLPNLIVCGCNWTTP